MKAKAQTKRKRRKITVHVYEGVRIRQLSDTRFMIDHRRGGVVTRKSYGTLAEAQTAASEIKTRHLNEGVLGFTLSQDDRRDAEKGKLLLDGRTTLEAACRFWLKHHPDTRAESVQRTMVKRLRAMQAAIDRGDMAPLTRRAVRPYYRAILKSYWNRPTSSISPNEVTDWVKTLTRYSKTTQHNIRGAFVTLLKFYETGRLREKRRDDRTPEVFPVEAVNKMFAHAAAEMPEAVPMLTVLFFCGLRPYEAIRLEGKNMNLADACITIDASTSKTRTQRVVDVPGNALKWLKDYPPGERLVGGEAAWRRMREKLMDAVKVDRWPVDAPRHGFATAHYVVHGDAAKTASQLGHFGGLDMFVRHYKALMTRKEAEAYFAITPKKSPGKIIRLPKVA